MSNTKKHIFQLIGLLFFLILVIGVGVGVYLAGNSQDTRQHASEAGIVDVTLSPQNSTYTDAKEATVQIMVDSGPNVVKVENLQFTIAVITGDIPSDLSFSIAQLPGVIKISTSLVDSGSGKRLEATLSNPSNSYSTNGASLPMGSFHFTPKSAGSMTITLDPAFASAFKGIQGNETIRLGGSGTYTFAVPTPPPSPTSTPTAIPAVKTQTTVQSGVLLKAATPTPAPSGGPTASPATLIAQNTLVTATETPTPTPEPTVTPAASPTLEPTATTTLQPTATPNLIADSSVTTQSTNTGESEADQTTVTTQSETTQEELPVTGSTSVTYVLLAGAISFLILGVGLFLRV